MNDVPGRMARLEFLCWCVSNQHRVQLGAAVAATCIAAAISIGVFMLTNRATAASPPSWIRTAAAGAAIVVYFAAVWHALGSRRFQRWITGG